MAQPIINPPMPFIGPIVGGFYHGKMIRIQGIAPQSGDRFDINLQCGNSIDPRSDIALHLSVRILEGYIPRNSFKDNMWEEEESEGSCPIGAGERFEILILSDDNQYKIAVNGQHYATFAHRLPNRLVSHLDIEGPVEIQLIAFEDLESINQSQSASSNDAMQYGPPTNQYGPPQGMYGPQGYEYGPYGPSPYGPSAPSQPREGSGLESLLETAGSAIAGALSAKMADNLIGNLTGSNTHAQPQQPPPPTSQQGGSFMSSLLSSLTESPQQQQPPPQQGGSLVSSLLSSLASEVLSPSNKRQGNY